ncbi:replication initiation protein [Thioalkalivibrio sp. ALMg11]|uniref:replication initiation protein n=1 Tax=Thioalkalivibrio sp. ALMg11 TaxID=1158165 RepID=UPI00036B35D0|nr:replication initiation protein [Thioalkalivibrio sp. ALMg11]
MGSAVPAVRMPSRLIESAYQMDLTSARLIRAALARVDLAALPVSAPVPDVLVSMPDVAPMMPPKASAAAYRDVRDAIDTLGSAELACARKGLRLRWLDRADYREGRGEAVLRFSEALQQLVAESDRVLIYEPSLIRGLMPRVIRLLEWIAVKSENGRACLDLAELREALGLVGRYPAKGDFRRFIIAEGLDRIRKRLGVELDAAPIRDGRKLLGVEVDTSDLRAFLRVSQVAEYESENVEVSQSQLQAQSLLQAQSQSQSQVVSGWGSGRGVEWVRTGSRCPAIPSPPLSSEPAGPQAQEDHHCDLNESAVCGPGEWDRGRDLDTRVPEVWLSWAESFCEASGLPGGRAMFRAEAARCLAYWREESCGEVSVPAAMPMWLWKAWLRRRMAGSDGLRRAVAG